MKLGAGVSVCRELGWEVQGSQDSPSHLPAGALQAPRGSGRMSWLAQKSLTLDFVEVAGLLLGQQGGMGVLPGIHLVHKEGAEPAAFIILGIEPAGHRNLRGHAGVEGALALPTIQTPCSSRLVTHYFWE